jgi:hypothetical protein
MFPYNSGVIFIAIAVGAPPATPGGEEATSTSRAMMIGRGVDDGGANVS